MKTCFLMIGIMLLSGWINHCLSQVNVTPDYANLLWYNRPAQNWNEAVPIGNGRLAAMMYGGVTEEHIPLNEQTLWSGAPRNWNNPGAKKYLALVRQAVAEKKYKKADSLSKHMQGPYTESYLPMADLIIRYTHIDDSASYKRELNIASAVSSVRFISAGNTYTRSAFASFPDRVIVLHDSCTVKGAISFSIQMTSKLHYSVQTLASNHIVLKGKCPEHVEPVYVWWVKDSAAIRYAKTDKGEGMNFEVHLRVNAINGTIQCRDNIIQVSGADASTILVSAATSFNGYDHSPGLHGKDPSVTAITDIKAAGDKSYNELLQRHLADYVPIFKRVQWNLGESVNKDLPTDERLERMDAYTDPELTALIAQYGRYLLIAGSRPGGQPVNLKGIWNDKVRPEYSSNWCIDHDAQMFYYAVETNNLPEMHQPFLQLIRELAKNGKKTALANYGMRGWCAHHNTDIWRQTAPVGNYGEGNPHWANWNMSGPWLCAHLFEHYLFSGDKKFLKTTAWPIMKGAALFCIDWLSKDSNGKLQTVPSVSPENTFITQQGDTAQVSKNSTIDISLVKELFTHCIETASILQTDKDLIVQLKKILTLLPSYKIGSKGQLQEWDEEWPAVDPAHRHLSHMYPVFPGSEISNLHTPALAVAAKKALTMRDKTNCSWGFAWKAACWARLGEGDSAWNTLRYQLQYVDGASKSPVNNYGLFPNLFNSEAPSTILNGNGCATAALTEMVLQSHTGEIQFLPALPSLFKNGSVNGLCARGGFVIDISWNRHQFSAAGIYSKLGNDCSIITPVDIKVYQDNTPVETKRMAKNLYVFKTKKGAHYTVRTL